MGPARVTPPHGVLRGLPAYAGYIGSHLSATTVAETSRQCSHGGPSESFHHPGGNCLRGGTDRLESPTRASKSPKTSRTIAKP
jgi:hypothetical protein